MFGGHHKNGVCHAEKFAVCHRAQAGGHAAGQGLRLAGLLIHNALQSLAGEQADGGIVPPEALILRQTVPGLIGLVLGETVGVFAGVAEGGAVNTAGNAAPHIAHHQLQGAAYGGVGAIPLTQSVHAGVHTQPPRHRPVHHHHRPGEISGAQQPMQTEPVIKRRLHRRQHQRHILRLTPRQHRIHGDLLHTALNIIRRHSPDNLPRFTPDTPQHPHHPNLRRRHHRQPVTPPPLKTNLHLILRLPHLNPPRPKTLPIPQRQPLPHPRLTTQRPTPRPKLHQPLPQIINPRKPPPLPPIPPINTPHLFLPRLLR